MLRQALSTTFQRALTPLLARTQPYSAAGSTGSGAASGTGDAKTTDAGVLNHADIPIIDYDDPEYLPLPEYPARPDEPLAVRKQRLIYQSRKRGMLENDLILSTFVSRYLGDMDTKLTAQYDQLINGVTNDWEIFYWATNVKPTPPEYDNEIMQMLKEHVANARREQRLRQPNL